MVRGLYGVQQQLQQLLHLHSAAAAQKALPNQCDLLNALNRLDRRPDIAVDNATYASLIRWCGDQKSLSSGRRVHAHVSASGGDRNTVLANLLLQMYGKCASVVDARNVFNKMVRRNMFSWNFMIAAYAQNGREAEALQLYRNMQIERVKPNKFTFFPLLYACARLGALAQGKQIHNRIVASGFDSDVAVRTALITMYSKCGSLENAHAIFVATHERDLILWTSMISAYAQHAHCKEALELLRRMDLEGILPDKITFLSTLDACASSPSLEIGRVIHRHLVASPFYSHVSVRTALVNMYVKCGALEDARAVFEGMHERDITSWTAIITAYAQNGHGSEALNLFRQMDLEGVKPDKIIFLSILDACARVESLNIGRAIHKWIIASGFDSDIAVNNALVNMYGKCGNLEAASVVFNKMHERDVISWNIMISAYVQNGQGKEAFQLFRQMNLDGIRPDKITFLNALDACACFESLENGTRIHGYIDASGFGSDVAVKNALINMYGKCGSLKNACKVFHKMHERNVISWTAMITAYAQNGCGKEALELFWKMQLEDIKPNRITFLGILDACASLACLENGRMVHESIIASGVSLDVTVCNALVNMYGKCGSLKDALTVFGEMPERDVISWNAMIAACAQNGQSKESLELFRKMNLDGVKPNEITFLSILNACSHAGFLDAGWHFFVSMRAAYATIPFEEHYLCMSDLLGRVGFLDEAEDLLMNMPIQPSVVAWNSLLGACRAHGDVERGERVAECIFELDLRNSSSCVSLSNIYAAAGRWCDASRLRDAMDERDWRQNYDAAGLSEWYSS